MSPSAIDHLVVAASTLEDGVRWCEHTLGVTPEPGGAHPLFGTHNRLLRLENGATGQPAYLEIIAINPHALPTRKPPLLRWFDLDDAALQAQLRTQGPQLIHWVLRVSSMDEVLSKWAQRGIQRGDKLGASRAGARGELRWNISVRSDGQRLMGGALPTLIEWGARHPCEDLPHRACVLEALTLATPKLVSLQKLLTAAALAPGAVTCAHGPQGLSARIRTPLGVRTLHFIDPMS